VKLARYTQDFTQFADNGKTVGSLNGAASVTHSAAYQSVLPSIDARYRLRSNWSVYAQFATGSVIPPTSVFDTKNGEVSILPKPTRTRTFQMGSKWKLNRWTLDVDTYYIHFDNPYSSTPDSNGEPVYYSTGASITKGVEAESNVYIGGGLSAYLNGTLGSAKYAATGLWAQNAPRDTEAIGLTYRWRNWDVGFFNKRIGDMYNDNGSTNEAIRIDPFNVSNAFINYTVKGSSYLLGTKIRLSVNNVFNQHSIVGVTPASTTTSVAAPGDILTLLPARSISLTFTAGYAPRR
jgi:iron complex outermembrane recepter protein